MRRSHGARRRPEPGLEGQPDTAASRAQPASSRLTDAHWGPVPVLVLGLARAVCLARAPARVQMPTRVRSSRFTEAPARRACDNPKDTEPNPDFGPARARALTPVCVPAPDNPRPVDQGCPVVLLDHGARRGPLIASRVDQHGRRLNHPGLHRTRSGRLATANPGTRGRRRQGTEDSIGGRAGVGLETIGAVARPAVRAADDVQRLERGPVPAGRGISLGSTATLPSRRPNS